VTNQTSNQRKKYEFFLNDHLKQILFASGSDLKALLMEEFNISEANARQAVSRAAKAKVIASSYPYTFGKNQYIYLYRENYLTVFMIMAVSQKSRPPMYRLLRSMLDNGGIISHYEGMKITASPGTATSTKVATLDDMIKVLSSMSMVRTYTDAKDVKYILFKESPFNLGIGVVSGADEGPLIQNHFNKMLMDAALMPDILRWLYRSNLIDNTKIIYRNKKNPQTGAVHNKLTWDAFSYTKATGINPTFGAKSEEVEKQTMVALDVVLSRKYSQEDLDGFLDRIQINLNSVSVGHRKMLPIIFYRECDELVLNSISKLGIIAFDIGAIFGQKIYEVLQGLNELNSLLQITDNADVAVKSVLKTIRKTGQDDLLRDLKGSLFEVLMYPLLKNMFGDAAMERGKTLVTKGPKDEDGKQDTEKYEYDFIIHSAHPNELIFVELKGYMSNVLIPLADRDKRNSLSWFFRRTLPFGATHYPMELTNGRVLKAMYITSAQFDQDGQLFIEDLNKGKLRSKNGMTAYDHHDLIQLLAEKEFKNEVKIIKKFYTFKPEKKKAVKPVGEVSRDVLPDWSSEKLDDIF